MSLNKNSQTTCPRCLGKGDVTWEDIKRLNQELKWAPGRCAYCNGSGTVDSITASTVPANLSYLTTDLTSEERDKLMANDPKLVRKAQRWEMDIDEFIKQILVLYFEENMEPEEIADYYLEQAMPFANQEDQRLELIDYVTRVIAKKTGRG